MENITSNMKKDRGLMGVLLLFFGIILLIACAMSISYFVIDLARTGFPSGAFSSSKTWLLIGLHAILGISGLIFLIYRRK